MSELKLYYKYLVNRFKVASSGLSFRSSLIAFHCFLLKWTDVLVSYNPPSPWGFSFGVSVRYRHPPPGLLPHPDNSDHPPPVYWLAINPIQHVPWAAPRLAGVFMFFWSSKKQLMLSYMCRQTLLNTCCKCWNRTEANKHK